MIVNPLNNKTYSLFNSKGRDILRMYIDNYKSGGSLEAFEKKRNLPSLNSDWAITDIPPFDPSKVPPPPSIRDRDRNAAFNVSADGRLPLPDKIIARLLRESKAQKRKFRPKKYSRSLPAPIVESTEEYGRGKDGRSKRRRSHRGSYEEAPLNVPEPPRKPKKKVKRKTRTTPVTLPPTPPPKESFWLDAALELKKATNDELLFDQTAEPWNGYIPTNPEAWRSPDARVDITDITI